jgi:hypothetical protein
VNYPPHDTGRSKLPMPAKYTDAERLIAFWAKVDKNGPVPETQPSLGCCWIWLGAQTRTGTIRHAAGYGTFWDGHKTVSVQRWALELALGRPIANGMTVDHLCMRPPCVNPQHLEEVTMRENILRSGSLAAGYAKRTHCKNGHLLSAGNVRMYGNWRQCLICKKATNARRARKKY